MTVPSGTAHASMHAMQQLVSSNKISERTNHSLVRAASTTSWGKARLLPRQLVGRLSEPTNRSSVRALQYITLNLKLGTWIRLVHVSQVGQY
jgi:hypothetical protein